MFVVRGGFRRQGESHAQRRAQPGKPRLQRAILEPQQAAVARILGDPQRTVRGDFHLIRFVGIWFLVLSARGELSPIFANAAGIGGAAAQGKPYACFVREDTKISFMAMPDAIKSLLMLTDVPRQKLNHHVYNIAAFALTAGEFRDRAVEAFPGAQITFEPNPRRQGIVDSWPEDVDDTLAGAEWGWKPDYDADAFFDDYFLPEIRKRYGK